MLHSVEDNSASETSELICDICGVNQSSSGKKFTHPSQVWQHMKKRHPEFANQLKQTDEPLSGEKSTKVSQSTKRTRRAESVVSAGNKSHVKFCPCCGFNLAVVHAAMEFVNGDSLS
jgi:hypothetical protein